MEKIKWLAWENAVEWGTIDCQMLGEEVMTYYPKGVPAFNTYTAPFVDESGEVCYYGFDQDEGVWDEDMYCIGKYQEGMKFWL